MKKQAIVWFLVNPLSFHTGLQLNWWDSKFPLLVGDLLTQMDSKTIYFSATNECSTMSCSFHCDSKTRSKSFPCIFFQTPSKFWCWKSAARLQVQKRIYMKAYPEELATLLKNISQDIWRFHSVDKSAWMTRRLEGSNMELTKDHLVEFQSEFQLICPTPARIFGTVKVSFEDTFDLLKWLVVNLRNFLR
jgi:hypothetical protein